MTKLVFWLNGIRACHEASDWVWNSGYRSPRVAWRECERADWMIWLLTYCSQFKGWPSLRNVLLFLGYDPPVLKLSHGNNYSLRLLAGTISLEHRFGKMVSPDEIRKKFPEIGPIHFELKRGYIDHSPIDLPSLFELQAWMDKHFPRKTQ